MNPDSTDKLHKANQRNLTVELLRVVFMFLILLLHYLIHGLGHHINGYVNVSGSPSYPVEMALIGICNIGVTGFMFISGYYGIRYRWNRVFSLWLQAAFYFLCLTFIAGLLTSDMHYLLLAKFWLPFTNGGWWFLMCYVFVYILSPVINSGMEHINQKELKWMLVMIGIMLYVGKFLSFALSTELILLLFIYMAGRYVKTYDCAILERHSLILFIAGALTLTLVPYALGMSDMANWLRLFFSNYNPAVAITAISLFFIAKRHAINHMHPLVLSLCSNTLAAYIITDYPLIREWLIERFVIPGGHSITHALICVTIGLAACMIIEEIRKRAMHPLEQALEKRAATLLNGSSTSVDG